MSKRKQITIKQFIDKCDSALKDEYYIEAITIATAIIDDRIQSISNKIFPAPTRTISGPHDSTIDIKFLEYSSVNIGMILNKYLDPSLVKINISDYEVRMICKMKTQSKRYIDFFSNNSQFTSTVKGFSISYTDLVNDPLLFPYYSHFIANIYGNIHLQISNQTTRLGIDFEGLFQLVYYKDILIPIRNKLIHNLLDWRFEHDLDNYNDLKMVAHIFVAYMRDFLTLAR